MALRRRLLHRLGARRLARLVAGSLAARGRRIDALGVVLPELAADRRRGPVLHLVRVERGCGCRGGRVRQVPQQHDHPSRRRVRTFDPALDEIATIYRFSALSRFRHVIWPQAVPFVVVAARSGIGIVWKIVIVVELFGMSSGVGFKISSYFQFADTVAILGYSVAFTLLMLAIELFILQPLDDYARRWRPAAP